MAGNEKTATALTPFHVAVQVRDLQEARDFYVNILGCSEGRYSDTWVDFNFFGHQLVCHLDPNIGNEGTLRSRFNLVDGHRVPVPHFGAVLKMDDWHQLANRLRAKGVEFSIQPHVRFTGQPGEQATMFLLDPSGNALEFKAFHDIQEQLFKK